MKAFRDDAMSATQIKVWHKCFKDGGESVKSDPCSGRPATSRTPENVEHVQAAINKDQQLKVRELEADLGIPKTTVSEILTQNFGMKHVVAKFFPWLLLPQQKEHCTAVADDLIQTATNKPDFLKKVITRDEFRFTAMIWKGRPSCPNGSRQVLQAQTRAGQSYSKIKTMLTVFFDLEGVVHHEYAPPGKIISK